MFIKIDHINLTVKNLEESKQWYSRVFGFKEVESGQRPGGSRWSIVACEDFMICMSEYPDLKPADESEEEKHYRIYHFGFRISDAAVWKETLRKEKIPLNYGGEIDYPKSISWYVLDPSGHEIEVSYAEGGKIF